MTGGTIEAARKLLEHPIFGNEEHIKAVHFLEREEEATALRKKLKGQRVDCWCCGGSGELDCLVGCLELHPCNTCDGQPKLELREAILGKLTLGQLRDIAKGLGI